MGTGSKLGKKIGDRREHKLSNSLYVYLSSLVRNGKQTFISVGIVGRIRVNVDDRRHINSQITFTPRC